MRRSGGSLRGATFLGRSVTFITAGEVSLVVAMWARTALGCDKNASVRVRPGARGGDALDRPAHSRGPERQRAMIVRLSAMKRRRLRRSSASQSRTARRSDCEATGMSELDRAMAAALSCFRAALEAASAHPSAEAVAVLRDAAVPIMARLRAEYVADGSPYGDENEGLFRWARGKISAGGHYAADWRRSEVDGRPCRGFWGPRSGA
jgi:hypothetical protein